MFLHNNIIVNPYRLLFARDDALARVGTKGPDYIVTQTQDNVNENIFRWEVMKQVLLGGNRTHV